VLLGILRLWSKKNTGVSYKAVGSVDFLGGSLVRVDGAGGPVYTTRIMVFNLSLAA